MISYQKLKLHIKYAFRLVLSMGFGVFAAGCGGGASSTSNDAAAPVRFDFKFSAAPQTWQFGFVDYPVGEEEVHSLTADWRTLPPPLDPSGGYYLSGHNQSVDLMMYLSHEITGLAANTRYALTFTVEFASDAASGCTGIGEPPGEGVVIKAGASAIAPERIIRNDVGVDYYRLNWDIGIQRQPGRDVIVLGNIATSQTYCPQTQYEYKALDNGVEPFTVFTDSRGVLWLFVGADSGYEGVTSLYFTRIIVVVQPI